MSELNPTLAEKLARAKAASVKSFIEKLDAYEQATPAERREIRSTVEAIFEAMPAVNVSDGYRVDLLAAFDAIERGER